MAAKKQTLSFSPSKAGGILFLDIASTILIYTEILLIGLFSQKDYGIGYFLLLMGMVLTAAAAVFLLYRLFCLIFSGYRFARNGLTIRWGLRNEVIPLNAIEWIRQPSEMPEEIPWSVLPMPGAYLGSVESPYYGQIEFLASDIRKMLFMGTAERIYALSPNDPKAFIEGFERILQLGVLNEIDWETVRPGNWILDLWHNKIGRISTIISLNLLALLFLWIGFRFRFRDEILLQFSAAGKAAEKLPVKNIMIIPMLATISWFISAILGGRLYQRDNMKHTAELVWCAGVLAIIQFIISVILIM